MTLVILALIACGPKAPDEATASADADADADADGDGAIAIADGGTDCDDADANVWPGAPEVCDGVQNDCSTAWASTDEDGLVTLFDTAETVSADLTATFASGTPSALTTYDLLPRARSGSALGPTTWRSRPPRARPRWWVCTAPP